MSIWWLSFVDYSRPEGSRFLGACVVDAESPKEAHFVATVRGCNPGGEVAIAECAPENERFVREVFPFYALISREAYEALDALYLERRHGSPKGTP